MGAILKIVLEPRNQLQMIEWVTPTNKVNYVKSLWRMYGIIIGYFWFSNCGIDFKNRHRDMKPISNDRVSQDHQLCKLCQTYLMPVWHHNKTISDFRTMGSILKIVLETRNQFQMIEWVKLIKKVNYAEPLWCMYMIS